jgi:2-polyprenyl-6-methoxyphenol hydroxylase-like FAD-dependent oxidoreductase
MDPDFLIGFTYQHLCLCASEVRFAGVARMYRVGVVGFGMAGATTAYLLACDGHRVTLLERAPVLGPVGAGILLQCSGQEVLRRLGVLDQVLTQAAPLEGLYARHARGGRTLINNRFPDLAPETRAYGVHRGVIFTVLSELVRSQPIEVRPACEIVAREDKDSGVTLLDACGRRHGPFDFVVAADGSRSRMRDVCHFKASITQYNHGTLWINAPGAGVPGRLVQVVERNRKLFGLLPLGDGFVSMYWGLPVRDFAAVKERGLDALKREIQAFAPEAEPVLDYLQDFEQFLFTTYRHIHCRRHFDDRVILIGDAAHAMSPHLGQGLNLALVDAWRLAEAVRDSATPRTAFRAFRQRQKGYIRYYATVTYLLSPFFQSDWGVLGWGRDWALPLLPYIPWVKRQMLLTVCGVKGGFLKGRMKV